MIDINSVSCLLRMSKKLIQLFTSLQKIEANVGIAPALGIDSIYYQKFALWLSNHGFRVVTLDYSPMGSSSKDNYKKSKMTISDWALFDCKKY
jgi:predicted alpha/beta hydrolase